MREELEYIEPVNAGLQEGVHALEGRLAQVQAVVHLERRDALKQTTDAKQARELNLQCYEAKSYIVID